MCVFVVSWSVGVFTVDFQPLSQQVECEEYSKRVGEEENTHTDESPYPPLCTVLPQQHPRPCPRRRYTGDARDKRADGCGPMVDGWSATSVWRRDLRGQGGRGFPGKLCEDLAWLVTMQRDGGGGRRSWRRRTAVPAHRWMAVVSRWVLTGFPLGQGDQVLVEDLTFSDGPPSPPPFFSRGQ